MTLAYVTAQAVSKRLERVHDVVRAVQRLDATASFPCHVPGRGTVTGVWGPLLPRAGRALRCRFVYDNEWAGPSGALAYFLADATLSLAVYKVMKAKRRIDAEDGWGALHSAEEELFYGKCVHTSSNILALVFSIEVAFHIIPDLALRALKVSRNEMQKTARPPCAGRGDRRRQDTLHASVVHTQRFLAEWLILAAEH